MSDEGSRDLRDKRTSPEDMDWDLKERGLDAAASDLMIDAIVMLDESSFDELVNLSGVLDALAAVRPYRRLDMQAANIDLRKRLKIESRGVDVLLLTYLFAGLHSVRKDNMSGEVKERGGVGTFRDCLYKDASPEFCLSISHIFTEALADFVNPEYECVWTHHQTGGDPYCRFVFKKRSDPASVLEDLGETVSTLPKFELPAEQIRALTISTGALFLNENTRAFVDLHGSEKTIDLLGANARSVGQKIGAVLALHNVELGRDAGSIGRLVHTLEKTIGQRGTVAVMSEDECAGEITDCTQQQFVKEQCKQFEALFEGIVSEINPNYEFAYERMMSEGDSTCRWVVRKKAERAGDKKREEANKIVRI